MAIHYMDVFLEIKVTVSGKVLRYETARVLCKAWKRGEAAVDTKKQVTCRECRRLLKGRRDQELPSKGNK